MRGPTTSRIKRFDEEGAGNIDVETHFSGMNPRAVLHTASVEAIAMSLPQGKIVQSIINILCGFQFIHKLFIFTNLVRNFLTKFQCNPFDQFSPEIIDLAVCHVGGSVITGSILNKLKVMDNFAY